MKLLRTIILAINVSLSSCANQSFLSHTELFELRTCRIMINISPNQTQVMNDGHGNSYVLSTPKGYILISDASLTSFDFGEYRIIRQDTINGINRFFGVHDDVFFRNDRRDCVLVYYANVHAKDTIEFNKILNELIVIPKQ